jgi:phage-related protein (TIGR01555 family)
MSKLTQAMALLSHAANVLPLSFPGLTKTLRTDSIQNASTGLGTYEDATTHGKPTLGRRLTDSELLVLYATSDIAQRIVDELVDDALRQGYVARDLKSGEEVGEPADHRKIIDKITEAFKEARLQGGAAILVQTKGTKDYSQPLDITKATEITGLLVLDRTELSIRTRDYDASSEFFTQALTYTMSPLGAIGGSPDSVVKSGIEVHRSHLIIFHGQRLPKSLTYANDGWSDSVLQACWDRVRNFEQTELSMGNIVQRFEISTYSINGLGDIISTVEGREKIMNRLKLTQRTLSNLRSIVLDKEAGESFERSFSTVNGLDTIWDRLAHSVAKAARMPMTQLFGTSPSGLATDDESGRANWRKQIRTVQIKQVKPALEMYYQLLNGGKEVKIDFLALDETTATEEADIAKTRAEYRKIYIESGMAFAVEFRDHMIREGVIVKADLNDETIEEFEELAERLAPPAPELGDPNDPNAADPTDGLFDEGTDEGAEDAPGTEEDPEEETDDEE